MQGMRILSLSQEDPRRKSMATHSSIPMHADRGACLYPWTEEPGELHTVHTAQSWTATEKQLRAFAHTLHS